MFKLFLGLLFVRIISNILNPNIMISRNIFIFNFTLITNFCCPFVKCFTSNKIFRSLIIRNCITTILTSIFVWKRIHTFVSYLNITTLNSIFRRYNSKNINLIIFICKLNLTATGNYCRERVYIISPVMFNIF